MDDEHEETMDFALLSERKHHQLNKRLIGKYGLDSDPQLCAIGNEMAYELLNASIDIINKYARTITNATHDNDSPVEDYLCHHLAAVWLAKHCEQFPQILIKYYVGIALGKGDSQRRIATAMGLQEISSGNISKDADIAAIKKAIEEMDKNYLAAYIKDFNDGFGGKVELEIKNSKRKPKDGRRRWVKISL